MIVVVVIGIMTTMITRVVMKKPTDEWSYILEELNNLIYVARQEALSTRSIHRVLFLASDDKGDKAIIEREFDDPEKIGVKKYEKATSKYLDIEYAFPKTIKLKALYVNGKSQFDRYREGKSFIYVTHEGLVQHAIVNLTRTHDDQESFASFIIEPFIGTFELKEGLHKP
jgi:hypothetical protein